MDEYHSIKCKAVEDPGGGTNPPEVTLSDMLQWLPGAAFVLRVTGERTAAFPYVSTRLIELVGVQPQALTTDATGLLQWISEQELEDFFIAARRSHQEGFPWQQELRINHPEKGTVWLEWNAQPVEQTGEKLWKGFVLDITERKLAQQKATLFEAISNHSSEAVYLLNSDGFFEYVNDALCHMMGYPREMLLNMGPHDIDPDATRTDVESFLQRVRKEEKVSFECNHLRRDGTVFPVEVIATPVDYEPGRLTLVITQDISQQRRISADLQRSEREFLSLTENIPDNIGRWDLQGCFLYMNPALEKTMQISAEHAQGRKLEDVLQQRFKEFTRVVYQVITTAKPAFMQRTEVPTADGEIQLHDVKIIPEFDDYGDLISVLGLGRDMTEHYRIQDKLTAYSSQLHLLRRAVDVSTDAFFIIDSSFRIIEVNDSACQNLGYTREELLRMTPLDFDPDVGWQDLEEAASSMKPGCFYLTEARHKTRDGRIYPVELGAKVFHENGESYSVTIARDISQRKREEQEKNWLQLALNVSADALYIVHLELDHHSFVSVNDTACQMLGYTREELMALSIPDLDPNKPEEVLKQVVLEMKPGEVRVVESVHIAKDGHRIPVEIAFKITDGDDGKGYMIAMVRDITQRINAEQAFKSLAENSPDFIISYDLEHRIRYLNEKLRSDLGLESVDDVLGLTPIEAWPDGRFNMFEQAIDQVISTGSGDSFEFEQPGENGSIEYRQVLIGPEQDAAGRMIGVLAFGRIITSLRENERRLQRLLENLPGVATEYYLRADGTGYFPYLSHGIETLYGVSHEEALGDGSTLFELVHPDDRDRIDKALADSAKNLTPYHEEYRILPRNASERWLEVRSVPERQADGGILWTGIKLDISERKLAQHRQYLLERALERMFDGSALVDRQGIILEANKALCEMLRYNKSELVGRPMSDIIEVLADTSWDSYWVHIANVGGVLQIETQCVILGGETLPTEVAFSVFEFEGASYILANIRNISERKQIEDRLQMAASVFDAASEGIIITDPDGNILDTNPAFTRITGYSRAEAIGRNPSFLSSGKQDEKFYEEMWTESLLKTGLWSGEVINLKKNGELYTEQLNIAAVHDGSGTLKHYVGIFTDISQFKRQKQHLQHIAHHDVLTNLPNRLLLTRRLAFAIDQAQNTGQALAILYLDLDGFKPINDNYGHGAGDRVLIKVAERLTEYLRATDTVARIGGDEFVILLTGVSGIGECKLTASRLLDVVSELIMIDDQVVNLSASIGVCVYNSDEAIDPDTLLRNADQAMYLAKSAGRNQFVFWDPQEQGHDGKFNQTIHDLRLAIQEEQFTVFYQPIIDLATGQVVKAEALIRWQHPVLGMVPPSEFIPVAENGGLIHAIGDLVFHNTVQLVGHVNELPGVDKHSPIQISVNRSPRQFFHRDGADKWIQYLNQQHVDGCLLGVEITEGLLLDDWSDVHRQLNQLRNIGFSISLDDFGTGYSALSYLKKFSIDYLKIDRSFINDIVQDADSQAIVKSIIAMARQLGIKTIGEGVETFEQSKILKAAGCDYAQGYYYAKPMPGDEFLKFVAHNRAGPRSIH